MKDSPKKVSRRFAPLVGLMTASLAGAQPAEPRAQGAEKTQAPAAAARDESNAKSLPTRKEVGDAAEKNDKVSSSDDRDVLLLSPFEVTTEKDRGYGGGSTMSGTRMGAALDDIANPMTVVT